MPRARASGGPPTGRRSRRSARRRRLRAGRPGLRLRRGCRHPARLVDEQSSPCSSFSCANGSRPVADDERQVVVEVSHSATWALTPTDTACEFTSAANTSASSREEAEREMGASSGPRSSRKRSSSAECGESELLDRSYGGQPDAGEQRVRREGVTRRGREHCEVRRGQRRRLEVLPYPGDPDDTLDTPMSAR